MIKKETVVCFVCNAILFRKVVLYITRDGKRAAG